MSSTPEVLVERGGRREAGRGEEKEGGNAWMDTPYQQWFGSNVKVSELRPTGSYCVATSVEF